MARIHTCAYGVAPPVPASVISPRTSRCNLKAKKGRWTLPSQGTKKAFQVLTRALAHKEPRGGRRP